MKTKEFMYLYGKLYDNTKEVLPGPGHYDIVIYNGIVGESRAIGSLEGIFASPRRLGISAAHSATLLRRNQMDEFGKINKGKFVPFNTDMEDKE